MAQNKKSNSNSKSRKKTPKKRKPKVVLDNRKVLYLTAAIVVLCATFLTFAFIFSEPSSQSKPKTSDSKPKVAVEKSEQPAKKASSNSAAKAEIKKDSGKAPSEKATKEIVDAKKAETSKQVQKQTAPQKKEPAPAAVQQPKKTEAKAEAKTETTTKQKSSPALQPKPAETKNVVQAKTERPSETAVPSSVIAQIKPQEKIAKVIPPSPAKEELPQKYAIPKAQNNATIVIVIDDAGLSVPNLKCYTSLPFPIAIAVLPKLSHTKDCAYTVRASGQELMLHQPMQAQNLNMNPGAGAILPDMSLSEVYAQIIENLAEVGPNVKGFNNHEGSLISCDRMKMGAVLDAAHDSGVFFLDSRTTKDTVAPQAALERDMKILERNVFIDDIISREEMLKQIYRGLDIANKKGSVIMIGHVDKSVKILPPLLQDMYPYLKAAGYKFAFPSQIK